MRRAVVLISLFAGVCLAAPPADAQSLGDRFERIFGPPVTGERQAPRRSAPRTSRAAPPTAPPALSSVPVPLERPAEAAEADTAEPEDEPADGTAAGDDTAAADGDPAPGREAAPNGASATSAEETPEPNEAEAPALVEPGEARPEREAVGPNDESTVVEGPADAAARSDEVPTPEPAVRPAETPDAPEPSDGEQSGSESAAPVNEEPRSENAEPSPIGEDAKDGDEAQPGAQDATPDATPQPAPAYVPPDQARTQAEPSAPDLDPAVVTPDESVEAAGAAQEAQICEAELRARGVEFTVEPSFADADCGVLRPVQVTRLSAGTAFEPDALMLCHTALALDVWVSEAVVPAAEAQLGEGAPSRIRHASGYVCRPRAGGGHLSEHAKGSAIDIAAIEWDARAPIVIEAKAPDTAEDRFLADIRRAACGPFRTVLGPGTDVNHADHFHFDIAARSNGATYCR